MVKKREHTFLDGTHKIYSYLIEPEHTNAALPYFVTLHGAGASSSEKFEALNQLVAAHGFSIIGLDFLSHGKSSGSTQENSLALRNRHALMAINYWAPESASLIICGSSMSGHTALRISKALRGRVTKLCLLQPAVYAAEAENVQFGPKFTKILRTDRSWENSLALKNARSFTGDSAIFIGSEDAVIPKEVTKELANALKVNSSSFQLNLFNGVAHEIPTWLPTNEDAKERLIRFLLQSNK